MSSIHFVRDHLAVCGFAAIGTREAFEAHGFDAQLQCAAPFDAWLAEVVEVKALPFDDGAPIPAALFVEAQRWLAERWAARERILVSCAGGQSRSVTMAIAALAVNAPMPFEAAVGEVLERVPGAYPHPHVLASAAAYRAEPLRFETLREIYDAVADQPPYPWTDERLREAAEDAQRLAAPGT